MHILFRLKAGILLLFITISTTVFSQVSPFRIFNNGMVLQRELPISIWGTATAEDTIIISLQAEFDTAFVNVDGNWETSLPAMNAGGPYEMKLAGRADTLTLTDVYIGDVWLASGQSNMEMAVSSADNASANIAAANNQYIREYKISKSLKKEPVTTLTSGSWKAATSSNVGNFSAAAYYFARDIQPEINIPIGIINSSYGGSRIETWMSDEALGYDEDDIKLANGESERQATLAYNAMINPLINFPIKGVLWYQGESNADYMDDAIVYGEQFKAMIKSWREVWGLGDIPFIWVQLPNQGDVDFEETPDSWDTWPQLRANQSRALFLPNTAEVVTIDVGDVDIHPTDKETVGSRLALATRKLVYGESIVAAGPRYKSHIALPNGNVQINFNDIGTGLVAQNTTSDSLAWFSCAGANGNLYKADAVISGNSVIVSCDAVADIQTIRYAWEYNPEGVNFYNQEGFPAAPFKIDIAYNGFDVKTFAASDTLIERGQMITLEWNITGASSIQINGKDVDSVVIRQLMPLDTITYSLFAESAMNPAIIFEKDITIYVIAPLPTISVSTKMGNVSPANEDVLIQAEASAPGGGTVTQVEFFIDGDLFYTDTEAPYETIWTPTELNTYIITAVVTNAKGATKTSGDYTMYINDLVRVRYEAEFAILDGNGSIANGSTTKISNGKYMKLEDFKTLTFTVEVPENRDYQVNLRYLMNFDPLKEQILQINGSNFETIRFEAEDQSLWYDYGIMLPLIEGTNTITIKNSWGWMSFDYIDVLGAIPPATLIQNVQQSQLMLSCATTHKNCKINYSIAQQTTVAITIHNMQSVLVDTISVAQKSGSFELIYNTSHLPSGIYIVSITDGSSRISEKIVVGR